MKLSYAMGNCAVAAAMMICSKSQNASAKADVHFFQFESSEDSYTVFAFDHSDTACLGDSPSSTSKLKHMEFVKVDANKNGETTIQTQILNESKEYDGYSEQGDCPQDYLGVSRGRFSKTSIHGHYVFYPSNSTICKAATDSNGDVIYDDVNYPRGICSGCSEIWTKYNDYTHRRLADSDAASESVPHFIRGVN